MCENTNVPFKYKKLRTKEKSTKAWLWPWSPWLETRGGTTLGFERSYTPQAPMWSQKKNLINYKI